VRVKPSGLHRRPGENSRLQQIIGGVLHEPQRQFAATGKACRQFADFVYRPRKSWSRGRRVVVAGTELAQARRDTIRLKLLKIGAVVRVTVRHVWVSWSGSGPYQALSRQVLDHLR
jgi:hypothetical protein